MPDGPQATSGRRPHDPLAVRRWVEKTCAEQGVEVAVSDPQTIAKLVALLGVPTSAAVEVEP